MAATAAIGRAAGLAIFFVMLTGCGDRGVAGDLGGQQSEAASDTDGRYTTQPSIRDPAARDGRSLDALDRREARALPSGAVVYPAPAAKETEIEPSDSCARSRVRQLDGRIKSVLVPPAPGVEATRVGPRTVEVLVAPGNPPSRCRPTFVNVLVDDTGDPYPPAARTLRLRGGGPVRARIRLLDQMATANTARATAGMRQGPVGPTSAVAVRR